MAITINSTRENDNDQTVYFSIDFDGEKSWHGDIPKDADPQEFLDAKEDTLKVEILRKQYNGADVPQLEDKTALESFEAWIAGGAKNAEITETRITPAQPAVDAVMGERQVVVESEEESEVSTTKIEEVDGKFVEKTTTETVTKQVSTPQFTEHQLYNEDGTPQTRVVTEAVEAVEGVEAVEATHFEDGDELPEGKTVGDIKTEAVEGIEAVEAVAEVTEPVLHSVPTMESFTISEATEPVAEQSETIITRPETVVEKVAWKDTSE
jgi:hypothetical protein